MALIEVGKEMFWIKLFRLDQLAYLNQQPYVIFMMKEYQSLGDKKIYNVSMRTGGQKDEDN